MPRWKVTIRDRVTRKVVQIHECQKDKAFDAIKDAQNKYPDFATNSYLFKATEL